MSDQPLLIGAEGWPEGAPRRAARVAAPSLDAEQLSFALELPVALGPEDFFVSESNADAHALALGGLRWPEGRLAVVGPEGSGKTHLLRIWAGAAGALRLEARDLGDATPLPPPGARVALDDLDGLPREGERALFHLLNHLGATGGLLLLASQRPPARVPVRLPDLASRLAAVAVARIEPPDDALLLALLAKLFADRGLFPGPEALRIVLGRIERSHAAAAAAVALLDRASLASGRQVTAALARRALDSREPDGR